MQSPRGAIIGEFCSYGVELPCVLCSPRQEILR